MRRTWTFQPLAACALAAATCAGCGTTRMTDTSRSATEMLLVSQAIDRSVNQLDFTAMAGKPVFFEEKVLDGTTDKNYLASSLRSKMLADGCLLVEERPKATYVVEARAGCVGTDKNSLLVGIPQMNLPTVLPGQPSAIPEMPLVKSTDQQGVAKVLVFAYNRVTGQAVWQSGVQESVTRAKDTWVCGAGPFQKGTIKSRIEGPIEQLDVLGVMSDGKTPVTANGRAGVTQAAYFAESGPKLPELQRVAAPAQTTQQAVQASAKPQ
jgi:hypothetical protein